MLAVADPALKLMLLLCRDAALRAATAYSINASHIVKGRIHVKTKNYGSIIVPLGEKLSKLVSAAVAISKSTAQPLVQALGAPGGPGHAGAMHHRLKRAKERAGVTSVWSFHDLRRTAAQALYEKSRDLRTVQSLLGHKQLGNTLRYLNAARVELTPEMLKAVQHG